MSQKQSARRLAGLLAVAVLLLPACTAGGPPSSATGRLDMFSWWTAGPEAAGLQALVALYGQSHPDVQILNEAGVAGANASANLKYRMLSSDPPDAFQARMGHELRDGYQAFDLVEPLDALYQSEGYAGVFPRGLLDIVSWQGHPWAVPVDIHRANVLWYNTQIFAAHHLQPPATFADFFQIADALAGAGITPLELGDTAPFAAAHLFETVLLGTLGAEGYKGLWTGATAWTDPRVTDALNTFKRMLGYINPDHGILNWEQADDQIIAGKAAMTVMVDWVDADFKTKKFADYGWAPAPNTAGLFDALADTFALPKGAHDRQNALDWLKVAGSRAGQDAFNPLAGAIPVRTDAGQGNYDAYAKAAMADWKTATIVPSAVHGAAAKDVWVQAFTTAISTFVTAQDVAATQQALAQACSDVSVCK